MARQRTAFYEVRMWGARNKPVVAAIVGIIVTVGVYVFTLNVERRKTETAPDRARSQLPANLEKSVRLAAQRGRWETCLEQVEITLEEGHPDPTQLEVQRILALDALERNSEARERFDGLLAADSHGGGTRNAGLTRRGVRLGFELPKCCDQANRGGVGDLPRRRKPMRGV